MPQTVISSSTLYCPVSEFINRCDVRSIQQLASDNNSPVEEAQLTSNGKVLAAIKDACGYIEAAAFNGGRYTKEDMETLAGTDCHARNLLYRLVSDLAQVLMMERRPDLNLQPTLGMKRSMEFLDLLWDGKRIFPFQEAADAGRLDHDKESPQDVDNRQLVTFTARALFGTRNNRLYD